MSENIFKIILIANTAEAFKKVLLEASHNEAGEKRVRHELVLSQRAFFWEDDNKVIVTPLAIPDALLAHNSAALGYHNVLNIAPKGGRIDLCRAILDDKSFWGDIVGIIKDNPGIVISPYAVTSDFLLLIESLRGESLVFSVPDVPARESTWTVEFLDSKSGFRNQLFSSSSEPFSHVRIPNGFICKDAAQAIEVGWWFLSHDKSCVIKSNLGESGWGVLLCRKENFGKSGDFKDHVVSVFTNDIIWNQFPLVVEELIDPLVSVAGGMPSGEAFVSSKGVEFKYACGQGINEKGEFLGVTVGDGVIPPEIEYNLRLATEEAGAVFAKLGYRGFFDVDFILTKEHVIYAIESNMRRTGGTHVYDLWRRLKMDHPKQKGLQIFSHDSFAYGVIDAHSPSEILDKAKDLLYPINSTSTGVVISLMNTEDSILGYMVIGRDNEEIGKIRQAFVDAVSGKD